MAWRLAKKPFVLLGTAGAAAVALGILPKTLEKSELAHVPDDHDEHHKGDHSTHAFPSSLCASADRALESGEAAFVLVKSFIALAVPTLGATVTSVVADLCQDLENRRTLARGGPFFADWLLSRASSKAEDGHFAMEQKEAQRAICHLLEDGHTSARVLERPGAVPMLLALSAPQGPSGPLAVALRSAMGRSPLPVKGDVADIAQTIDLLRSKRGAEIRPLAAWALASWAEGSSANRHLIVASGGVASLAEACADAVGGDRDTQLHLARAMRSVAEHALLQPAMDLSGWIRPLHAMVSSATAAGDVGMAAGALGALATCVDCGNGRAMGATLDAGVLPFLHALGADAAPDLRRSAAQIVGRVAAYAPSAAPKGEAAGTGGGSKFGSMPHTERLLWVARLVSWAHSAQEEGTQEAAVGALREVANTPDLLAEWLGDVVDLVAGAVLQDAPPPPQGGKGGGWPGAAEDGEAFSGTPLQMAAAVGQKAAEDLRTATAVAFAKPHALDPEAAALLSPQAIASYQEAAHAVDEALARSAERRALKALAEMVRTDASHQMAAVRAGLLPLLGRLVGGGEGGREQLELGLRRQVARLLAILTPNVQVQRAVLHGDGSDPREGSWLGWLVREASAPDNKLSSHAARALVHLAPYHHSRRGGERPASERLEDLVRELRDAGGTLAEQWARLVGSLEAGSSPAAALEEAIGAVGARMSAGSLAGGGGEGGAGHPPIIMDGVHLINPDNPHHRALAEGRTEVGGAPRIDVVFVHGLRGGAFSTWRPWIPATPSHEGCWPREWLGEDLGPQARLLTVGYRTRLSDWSGSSIGVRHIVNDLAAQMAAAGVGQRPVVFVTHSMGGLLVKEMLVRAAEDGGGEAGRQLVANTRGVVFYSVPHFGSWLAQAAFSPGLGRMLRPSVTIESLQREAPHLLDLNQRFRDLHRKLGMRVMSYSEERATRLLSVMNSARVALHGEVVPMESAYPGYGDFAVLKGTDHVTVCKPEHRADPSYAQTLEFLKARLAEASVKGAIAQKAAAVAAAVGGKGKGGGGSPLAGGGAEGEGEEAIAQKAAEAAAAVGGKGEGAMGSPLAGEGGVQGAGEEEGGRETLKP